VSTIHEILKQYWGFDTFRYPQQEIIESVLEGNDTLALLPTGGGKSICFQVPALAMDGMCIVISPLIALMKDQVDNLVGRGIKAATINSSMHYKQIDVVLNNAMLGEYKFLYLSPERILTDIFSERLKKMNVSLIAIDEAHCISQWGYDFRPAYLQIVKLREMLPKVPCIALTATATADVVEDIQEKLQFKNQQIFRKSFVRKNISYVVLEEENKLGKLSDILKKVSGTGIVYVRNRKRTKDIAAYLYKQEISADFYHAGLSNEDRERKQSNWVKNKTRIIVCTNAFGMGIDKPDVRVVVHMDMPPDLESYYQEAGRAGRDEKKAYAVLLFHKIDATSSIQQLKDNEVSIEEIRYYYDLLCQYFLLAIGSGKNESFDFSLEDFCQKYALNPTKIISALKILEQQEIILATEAIYSQSKVMITCNKEELYKLQISHKQYDPLIKLLLRSYEGLFENFVNIKESYLANKLKTTIPDIKKALVLLQSHKYLEYIPENNSPKIQFLQERHNKNNVLLDSQFIKKRYKNKERKLNDMIYYASSAHICRNILFSKYFGEDNQEDCKVCDVCLKKKKLGLDSSSFNSICEAVLKEISIQPNTLQAITKLLPKYKETEILQAVQWMLETITIIQNDMGKFEKNSNK
jgi:ATP-dependent DNA helicase RecQ